MSRTELAEQRILKRREKRLWEEKRNKIMFDYTQFSYYGPSVSRPKKASLIVINT